jgi:hypothetical protein
MSFDLLETPRNSDGCLMMRMFDYAHEETPLKVPSLAYHQKYPIVYASPFRECRAWSISE